MEYLFLLIIGVCFTFLLIIFKETAIYKNVSEDLHKRLNRKQIPNRIRRKKSILTPSPYYNSAYTLTSTPITEPEPTPASTTLSTPESTAASRLVFNEEPSPESVSVSTPIPTPTQSSSVSTPESDSTFTPEPSPAYTSTFTPASTLESTSVSAQEPSPVSTSPSTTEPAPESTPASTSPSTPEPAPASTSLFTPEPTPVSTSPSTPEPTPASISPSTPEPAPEPSTITSTPEPTPASTSPSTPEPTPASISPSKPEPAPEPSTITSTPAPITPSTPEPTPEQSKEQACISRGFTSCAHESNYYNGPLDDPDNPPKTKGCWLYTNEECEIKPYLKGTWTIDNDKDSNSHRGCRKRKEKYNTQCNSSDFINVYNQRDLGPPLDKNKVKFIHFKCRKTDKPLIITEVACYVGGKNILHNSNYTVYADFIKNINNEEFNRFSELDDIYSGASAINGVYGTKDFVTSVAKNGALNIFKNGRKIGTDTLYGSQNFLITINEGINIDDIQEIVVYNYELGRYSYTKNKNGWIRTVYGTGKWAYGNTIQAVELFNSDYEKISIYNHTNEFDSDNKKIISYKGPNSTDKNKISYTGINGVVDNDLNADLTFNLSSLVSTSAPITPSTPEPVVEPAPDSTPEPNLATTLPSTPAPLNCGADKYFNQTLQKCIKNPPNSRGCWIYMDELCPISRKPLQTWFQDTYQNPNTDSKCSGRKDAYNSWCKLNNIIHIHDPINGTQQPIPSTTPDPQTQTPNLQQHLILKHKYLIKIK